MSHCANAATSGNTVSVSRAVAVDRFLRLRLRQWLAGWISCGTMGRTAPSQPLHLGPVTHRPPGGLQPRLIGHGSDVGLDQNGRLDRWGLFCLSTVKSEASPSEFETRLYRNSDGWDCTDRGRSRVEIASERNRSQADREAAGCGKVTSSAISEPRPGDERITS